MKQAGISWMLVFVGLLILAIVIEQGVKAARITYGIFRTF